MYIVDELNRPGVVTIVVTAIVLVLILCCCCLWLWYAYVTYGIYAGQYSIGLSPSPSRVRQYSVLRRPCGKRWISCAISIHLTSIKFSKKITIVSAPVQDYKYQPQVRVISPHISRGVNLAWERGSWVRVWKREKPWVLIVQQTEARSTGLRLSARVSPEFLFYIYKSLYFLKVTTFGSVLISNSCIL